MTYGVFLNNRMTSFIDSNYSGMFCGGRAKATIPTKILNNGNKTPDRDDYYLTVPKEGNWSVSGNVTQVYTGTSNDFATVKASVSSETSSSITLRLKAYGQKEVALTVYCIVFVGFNPYSNAGYGLSLYSSSGSMTFNSLLQPMIVRKVVNSFPTFNQSNISIGSSSNVPMVPFTYTGRYFYRYLAGGGGPALMYLTASGTSNSNGKAYYTNSFVHTAGLNGSQFSFLGSYTFGTLIVHAKDYFNI